MEFSRNPAPLTVAVSNASRTYGDANPAFSATITGFVLGQDASVVSGLSFSTAASQASNVGNYAITSSGGTATNYVIASRTDGTLAINPASIVVTAVSGSSTYGDSPSNPGLSANGLQNGESVSVLTGLYNSFGITSTTGVASSPYTLTVAGTNTNTNYTVTGTVNGTWTINPKSLTYNVSNASGTYGTLATPGAATLTGVLAGDTANVAGSVTTYDGSNNLVTLAASTNAGSYTEKVSSLTGSAANNYTIASTGNTNGTLTSIPHPLLSLQTMRSGCMATPALLSRRQSQV